MHLQPSLIEPTEKAVGDLHIPDRLDLSFEGFSTEAFSILERLRAHPHIEQYRKEKDGVRAYITAQFKRYRDDLAVNWVLRNGLDFETEKNVFSRLLKNDFGAGGCHHHLWMAFYRPPRRRLTDAQLSHSISPDGFTVGLYLGDGAKGLFRPAKARMAAEPATFLALLNPLLQRDGARFYFYAGTGTSRAKEVYERPLDAVPQALAKAKGVWIRRLFERDDVLRWQGDLVRHALEELHALWPLYRFLVRPEMMQN